MEKPVKFELEKTCRCCMMQDTDTALVPLFQGERSCKVALPEIFQIVLFFNLGVQENDGLPQQLCSNCLSEFLTVKKFRKRCKETQEKLIAYFPTFNRVEIVKEQLRIEKFTFCDVDIIDCSQDSIDETESDNILTKHSGDMDLDESENENSWKCEYLISAKDDDNDDTNDDANENHEEEPKTEDATRDNELKYICKYCKQGFRVPGSLTVHIRKCPDRNEEICEYCTATFKASEFDAHMEEFHKDNTELMCPICQRTFKSTLSRDRHINYTHKAKPPSNNVQLKCEYCLKIFNRKDRLKNHIAHVHFKEYKECTVCKKKFTNEYHFKNHMSVHAPKKKYQCHHCPRMFLKTYNRKMHERTHTGERPFLCSHCGKTFRYEQQINIHVARFHPESSQLCDIKKPIRNPTKHQCKICEKYLCSAWVLKRHMESHDKNFPGYRCEVCNKVCRTKFILKYHTFTVHCMENSTDEQRKYPFSCTICSKGFLTPNTLSAHMKTHKENRQYSCEECGSAFKRDSHLKGHIKRMHLKIKEFECPECENKFSQGSELKAHLRTHTDDKPFKCAYCDSSFRRPTQRRNHERIHTGEKPSTCEICKKGFINNVRLAAHMLTKHSADENRIIEERVLRDFDVDSESTEYIKDDLLKVNIDMDELLENSLGEYIYVENTT